jgi:hypothetical protein
VLPEDLLDRFTAEIEARGMTQREATLRVIRTFLSLPPDVRALMLGVLTPELTAKVSRMVLRELGRK